MVLSLRLATASSGNVPALKLPATSATGFLPTVKLVSGKIVEPGTPVNAPPVPRLPESKESVIGKRSPTKKLAGFPSCARRSTWRPLCTSERESEKLAAPLGSASRKEQRHPPHETTPGIPQIPLHA